MRIGLLGGLRVENEGHELAVSGAMQLAVLFRLAIDAGSAVGYRSISEDVWSMDAPENTRAALQSIVSRLRSQLPPGVIESTAGGYRLNVARDDVDALAFCDLVSAAAASPGDARRLASDALALWTGEPWVPSDNFDWFERDLRRDRETALGLGGTQPPLPTHRAVPVPLTSLVGRATELAMIGDQLAAHRLVTIVGTGGAGKTRLAIEIASRRRGALLVELAPVGSDEVMAAIQSATGRDLRTVEASETASARDRVLEALHGRDVLLVLDNCEHVIDETARVAEDLLENLPQLRILATSREPLAIPGEAYVAVGSLPHPTDLDLEHPDTLASFAAVELFTQRAAAATGADLTGDAVVVAARICARLDGLPLALELAAAKLRTMTVDEVLAGLEHRFTLLTGGYRTALPRHQTLRAMIDWSWSLLGSDERVALAWIAVFPSGVDATEADQLARLMGLTSAAAFEQLVDKSLLQRARGRYRTLETIREYGLERLAESGSTAKAREVQARHCAAGAAAMDARLRGPRIYESIAWFDTEEDNISAALRYALAAPLPHVAVDLVIACAWYWTIRDRSDDAQLWMKAVAPLAGTIDRDEARLVAKIGQILSSFDGRETEEPTPDDFQFVLEQVGPVRDLHFGRGSHELLQLVQPALAAFSEAVGSDDWMIRVRVPRGEDLGLDPWPTAVLHVMRAATAQNRGEADQLGFESQLAIEHFEQVGDLWGLAIAQEMRALWLQLDGRLVEALELSDRSTANMRSISSSWDIAQQQGLTISVLARLGRWDTARERVESMLAEAAEAGNTRAELQAQINAVTFDLLVGDVASAGSRLSIIDELALGTVGGPPQTAAWIANSKAYADLLRADPDAAEQHFRIAVAAAVQSHDQPVIGMVAIGVGTLALYRGDIRKALAAVDLADALVGAHDATDPRIRAIEEAAVSAKIGRDDAPASPRPMAVEALQRLVGSD